MVSIIDEDEEFTKEIIGLFINNLVDFRQSLAEAVKQGESGIYSRAHHRIITTLSYVNNARLNDVILRVASLLKEHGIQGVDENVQNAFCRCCTSAIKGLQSDLERLKSK